MKNKKTLILSIVAILVLVCVTVGVSLAFFNYAGAGTTDNTVETGSITFLYTETSNAGRGIAITDAFPVSNEEGKALTGEGNVYDFNISATKSGNNKKIDYEITARKSSDSTLDDDLVVMYLTKVDGINEEEVLLDKYSELSQTTKTNAYTEKVLYTGTVYSNDNYDQDYRLRMWITDDGTFTQDDMGKTFTVTVNVYSNATVAEVQKTFEDNTNLEHLYVKTYWSPTYNLEYKLTSIENKNYDYELSIDQRVIKIVLNIIAPENYNATAKVEKITDTLSYDPLTRTLENFVEGDNYFKIIVTSENGKFKDEYIVKVQASARRNFSDSILKDWGVINEVPTLTTSSNNTSDPSGLYKSTATNSGNPTYYFRGNVENNYVSFAGMNWRIVRINEDGTVRLILQNAINDTKYKFNTTYKSYTNMYYTNSELKATVDSWYQTNLASYSDKIATGNYFCEEAKTKSDASYVSENATMAVYTDYTPDFKCSTDGNGYGLVNSNIGLLTYDEIVYAGGYYNKSNSSYYLNKISTWTMSPGGIYTTGYTLVWYSNPKPDIVARTYGVYPVINLKADVTVSGLGISTLPYVVQ